MKKIIGLYGRPGSGKTTTLYLLIELLVGKRETEEKKDGNTPFIIDDYRGKKIIIATAGDSADIVKQNIEFFEKQEADILVTAARNGDNTGASQFLDNYYNEASDALLIWFGKNHSTSLAKMIDVMQAKELRAFLDLLIEEWDNYPEKWSYVE